MPRWLKITLLVVAVIFIFAHPASAGHFVRQAIYSITTFARSMGVS